ncbi:hypothetical protein RN001_008020 [Aquatica leii]|uniref:MEIOB-like N-terminal domain-containing protein n=1 Tax=Aquatica leii TaxID=1421715 RepID=A0AAN7PX33_9COLE|nr:hypothetical protein RN001_008020 [Aquatica leii]
MDSDAGLQRVQLSALTPDLTNALIVGIIIAKQEPRVFGDGQSAVWNFTLRDSPLYYINTTCWGTKEVLSELNEAYSVGDVVNIISPQIEIRKTQDPGEQFRPMVTSPYTLILNDVTCMRILKHEGTWNPYLNLLHYTTKPIAGAITIADIHNFKRKMDGVDIFGIIRLVGKIRTVTTRIGVRQVREIVIMDHTSSALRVNCWDPNLISRTGTWKISKTVVFITDVRCEWSDFSSSMTATLTSRSILTEDPVSIETENLRNYVKRIGPLSFMDSTALSVQDVSSIQNVMNIHQVLDRVDSIKSLGNVSFEEKQFTALLYAVVTHLDLDGLNRLVATKCSRCDSLLENNSHLCSNNECNQTGQESTNVVAAFDLRLMLSDHTGSLTNCRLSGATAEKVLNCSVLTNTFYKQYY